MRLQCTFTAMRSLLINIVHILCAAMHAKCKWKYLAKSQSYTGCLSSNSHSPLECIEINCPKPECRIICSTAYHLRIREARASWKEGVQSPTLGVGDCCSRRRDGDNASRHSVGPCGEIEDRSLRCRSSGCWRGEGQAQRHRETGGTWRDGVIILVTP
jgi:hypothetical protein